MYEASEFDLGGWIESWMPTLDKLLHERTGGGWPEGFREPLAYPLFSGGKRVRPALAVAAFQAFHPKGDLTAVLHAAAAVELIHTYSLVHDDLPAMDDDDERRGRPTVHKAWDEPTAILVGDALLTEAFAVLADAPCAPEIRVALVRTLADAAGHRGMVGGQVADIAGAVTDVTTLTRLHRMKTGALIRWSVEAGGRIAGVTPDILAALGVFGANVGLAFQLADDVLDADEDAGTDGPPSFVSLLGVDETRRQADVLAADALAAANALPEASALVALARFIVERDH